MGDSLSNHMRVDPTVKAFFDAVSAGSNEIDGFLQTPDIAKRLLVDSRRPSCPGGDTVLHIAARSGNMPVLALAVEAGADIEAVNASGKRPLHEAAQCGHLECTNFLIENGANVNALKRGDWTPLMLTVASCVSGSTSFRKVNQHLEILRLLLKHGADVSAVNKDGWNCLHLASRGGVETIIYELTAFCAALVSGTTNNGRTPLHCLALSKSVQPAASARIAHNFLLQDSRLLYSADACGCLPIMDALRQGSLQLARYLLDESVDSPAVLLLRDKLGFQAIHIAAEAGQVESVQFVLDAAGKESAVSVTIAEGGSSLSPLHLACREGHPEVINLLTDAICNLSTDTPYLFLLPLDGYGRSPLYYAASGAAGVGFVGLHRRLTCFKDLVGAVVLLLCRLSEPLKTTLKRRLESSLIEAESLGITEFTNLVGVIRSEIINTTNSG
ncbi:hypothetical protein AAHC03_04436 [Spirometra sp. Aus1]